MTTSPSWSSLGLSLNTAALPAALTEQLQQRWATSQRTEQGFPVEVKLGQVRPRADLPQQRVTVSNGVTTVRVAQDEAWIGGLQLTLNERAATISADLEAATETDWLLALAEVQRLAGWLPLHAATVARNGHAVSLCGVSGAGKSTAALRLRAQGFSVVAEDQTWVHPASSEVAGLDRALRAFPESVERFAPSLLAQATGYDLHGKLVLPLDPAPVGCQLRAMLVFGLPASPAPHQAVRTMWETVGVPLMPLARQASAAAVSRLLARLPLRSTSREQVLEQVEALLTSESLPT